MLRRTLAVLLIVALTPIRWWDDLQRALGDDVWED